MLKVMSKFFLSFTARQMNPWGVWVEIVKTDTIVLSHSKLITSLLQALCWSELHINYR